MIKGIFITTIVLLFLMGFSTAAENACVGCHTSVGAAMRQRREIKME